MFKAFVVFYLVLPDAGGGWAAYGKSGMGVFSSTPQTPCNSKIYKIKTIIFLLAISMVTYNQEHYKFVQHFIQKLLSVFQPFDFRVAIDYWLLLLRGVFAAVSLFNECQMHFSFSQLFHRR